MRKLKPMKAALVGILVVSGAWAVPATAQSNQSAKTETTEPSRQFGAEAGAIVMGAQELMAQDQFDGALNKLSEALSLDGLNAYERSVIFQMKGACFYELDQYKEAISAFENAIDAGGLQPKERRALEFNVAQLLIASDQFEKGAVMIEKWHGEGGVLKDSQLEMLWQAWSQAGRYDRALPWAEKWFNRAGTKSRKHYDTLNFLYNNLGMPEKQIKIIEQMIEKWPEDKTLWNALASMLANNGQEEEAFELKLRQYDAGLLNGESELTQLVQYHSYYGIPFQGAQLMQRELEGGGLAKTADNYTVLADLWRQAREYDRAIPVLEQAVALSGRDAAPTLSKLAEALYHQNDCSKAQAVIGKVEALGSRNLASLYTQLGVCFYEKSQDLPRAQCGDPAGVSPRGEMQAMSLAAFKASTEHKQGADKTVHKTALSWTNFIKGEQASKNDICEAMVVEKKDRCFQVIDQAYKAKFITGTLKIEDECIEFKDEFDTIYRPKISEQ